MQTRHTRKQEQAGSGQAAGQSLEREEEVKESMILFTLSQNHSREERKTSFSLALPRGQPPTTGTAVMESRQGLEKWDVKQRALQVERRKDYKRKTLQRKAWRQPGTVSTHLSLFQSCRCSTSRTSLSCTSVNSSNSVSL